MKSYWCPECKHAVGVCIDSDIKVVCFKCKMFCVEVPKTIRIKYSLELTPALIRKCMAQEKILNTNISIKEERKALKMAKNKIHGK